MTKGALRYLAASGIAAAIMALPGVALAKATCPAGFPNKPLKFSVGFGAGGGTDVIGRAVAKGMETQQGWTIVVDNKPGAGGGVLAQWLKSQAADGYTIGVMATDSVAIGPAQDANIGYTYVDFEYLGSGMQTWSGLVALKEKNLKNVADLVALAKSKGQATVSVAGANQEVMVKQMAEQYGVNLVAIPGNGAADAMQSALGGHVDATMQGTLHVAQIKEGKMIQLASLIDRRVPYAPDSGTLPEQGVKTPPLDSHTMFALPKGVPADIQRCLAEAIDESVTKDTAYLDLMKKWDNEALNLGPKGTAERVEKSAKFYKEALAKK